MLLSILLLRIEIARNLYCKKLMLMTLRICSQFSCVGLMVLNYSYKGNWCAVWYSDMRIGL